MLAQRRLRRGAKTAGAWTEGMPPLAGLPFGDPAAQSAGAGFLPALPELPWPRLSLPPRVAALMRPPLPPAATGLWLVLAGFGLLLLVLAVAQ
jgi:hypothetical protein